MESQTLEISGSTDLIFAEPRGFCFGVRRAIYALEDALARFGIVYSIGSPIHNSQEIERLCSMGLKITENAADIPSGSAVFIRAHGLSNGIIESFRARNCKIIDGTCPFVRKAQEKAAFLAEEGYLVIILGDSDHPEVRAIREFAKDQGIIVDPGDISPDLTPGTAKIGVVSQTTQRMEALSALVSSLSAKFEEVRVFNTICSATSARQESVARLAGSVDGIIVIGGKNSANTAKLVEISEKAGTPTMWIEHDGEIGSGWFRGKNKIGIASGASTPDWLIHKLETKLASAKSAREDELVDD